MAAKKAVQATAAGLLILALLAAAVFFYLNWDQSRQKLADKEANQSQLESQIKQLEVRLDNLTLQNEDLANLLKGQKSKAEQAEKQAEALAAAEKRMKAKMEQALAKAAEERAEYEAKLEAQKKQEANSRASLEEKLNDAIASKNVVISRLQDKLRVDVADKILFELGSAELLPGGKKVLDELALVLADSDEQMIQVAGHTDDLPISSASFRYPTNWELSAARALSAVRYLEEVCGIKGEKLAAVAHGPYQPRVPNDSPENRAKNRRIEILLSPIIEVED
jgi:chemotaxis protein MotB